MIRVMAVAGLVLLILGFFIAAPRGSVPGSIARRQVAMFPIAIYTTPGYQSRLPLKSRRNQIVVGLLMFVIGVVLLVFGL